jgi:hypothetical protein
MTRVLRVLFVITVLALPRTAHASLWDWIQEFSGPGPSNGRGNIAATLCLTRKFEGRPLAIPGATTTGSLDKIPCVFFDYRRFENQDDDNFPAKVTLNMWDFGPTWTFLPERQIQIGPGLGVLQATGNNATSTHFTVTLVRFGITPLALVPGWEKKRLPRILKWYYRETLVPGTLDATDFGVTLGSGPGQSLFSAKNDLVRSAGFMIDLGELVFR